MNKKLVRIVVFVCMGLSCMMFAFASHDYQRTYYTPFIGLEHGTSEILQKDAPFAGIVVGTKLSSRVSVAAFATAQILSDFPGASFNLNITEVDSAFALLVGGEISATLFRKALFNPMISLRVGNMTIGHLSQEDSCEQYGVEMLQSYLFSSVSTGFEFNLFRNLSISFLHGYRYAPHNAIIGIPAQALCGSFSTVSFRARLD